MRNFKTPSLLWAQVLGAAVCALLLNAQAVAQPGPIAIAAKQAAASTVRDAAAKAGDYILGPEDTVTVKVLNLEELGTTPFPIDLRGNLDLPMAGTMHAAGLTTGQLEDQLRQHFKDYLQDPVVHVSVAEFRSQPISVLGQVGNPGVHQMRGRKTLFEVISEAGGIKPEAGNIIKITRQQEQGPIPLADARVDASGVYSVAEVKIRDLMEARNPADNISVKPYDVITVPKADLIYVIGSVKKAGGFVLAERGNMSVLQALSLAEGPERTAATDKAKIIRQADDSGKPVEIPVNVKNILNGKSSDVPLIANDILFLPNSAAKSATYRTLDALLQASTGAAIYRPF